MTNPIEQQARELLALGLDEYGHHNEAENVRNGEDLDSYRVALFALNIALIRALGAPDNADVLNAPAALYAFVHSNGTLERDGRYKVLATDCEEQALRLEDTRPDMTLVRYGCPVPKRSANRTPAARVSVSGEDLALCERGAGRLKSVACEETLSEAAAIRRLVQAVKGEQL